jgi:hypothetical protein
MTLKPKNAAAPAHSTAPGAAGQTTRDTAGTTASPKSPAVIHDQ